MAPTTKSELTTKAELQSCLHWLVMPWLIPVWQLLWRWVKDIMVNWPTVMSNRFLHQLGWGGLPSQETWFSVCKNRQPWKRCRALQLCYLFIVKSKNSGLTRNAQQSMGRRPLWPTDKLAISAVSIQTMFRITSKILSLLVWSIVYLFPNFMKILCVIMDVIPIYVLW